MHLATIIADPRWQSVMRRDAGADGSFCYAVKTTGVYCRPSCAARLPKPENVAFFAGPHEAEQAGYRACKRCKPDQAGLRADQAALIARICRIIESAEEPLRLAQLAEIAGLSPYHFHRLFKAITGVTPKDYEAAQRRRRVQARLQTGESVTDALYNAGFQSSAPFYADSAHMLGMTPRQYRAGGPDITLHFALGQCSLGTILVAGSAHGIAAIFLGDSPEPLLRDLRRRFRRATLIGDDPDYAATLARVVGLVEAPAIGLDLPLDVRGTAFQQRVWQALRGIAPGSTVSYSALAAKLGVPGGARAVASACAANPLAVVIPCHRVIRQDGDLSGYRWGVERKRKLLAREALRRDDPQMGVSHAGKSGYSHK